MTSTAAVTGLSLRLALTSVAAAIAPILAGLSLLRGVREPQRATQPSLTGAFRTIRQLVAAQGASFLGRGG